MAQGSDAFREVEIPAKRFGIPEEFGALCVFVCSSHASYLNGQNLLIDGGAIRSNHYGSIRQSRVRSRLTANGLRPGISLL
jgi:hypothetical protein